MADKKNNNSDSNTVLEIKNLSTYFHLDEGVLKAVDDVSLQIKKGEIVGVLGESGCGKSMMAHSILRLQPKAAKTTGEILLYENGDGAGSVTDLNKLSSSGKKIRRIRSGKISMIFQEPMTSLSPVHTVGSQMMEAIRLHLPHLTRSEAKEHAIDMLEKVGIPSPAQRFEEFAHQLSGGLRQRAMIAIALSTSPDLLIADEPTTALDVTVQAQILALLQDIQNRMGLSIMYITHSLPVIAEIADRVVVMYLGRIVESGSMEDIFFNPKHPYTQGLLQAIPHIEQEGKQQLLPTIPGTVPQPIDMGEQCGFYSRCSKAIKGVCDCRNPQMIEIEDKHMVRCVLYES